MSFDVELFRETGACGEGEGAAHLLQGAAGEGGEGGLRAAGEKGGIIFLSCDLMGKAGVKARNGLKHDRNWPFPIGF